MSENKHSVPINYNRLNRIAEYQDWSSVLSVHDPNEATNLLISMIQKCIQLAKETKKITKNKLKSVQRKKWITPAILNSCNRKEHLYLLWKKSPENKLIENEYKKYAKILDKVIKLAKIMFDSDNVKSSINDSRKLWSVLNNMIGKKTKTNDEITYIIDSQNKKIYDPDTISNLMNSYFCNIGIKLSDQIKQPINSLLVLPDSNPNFIFIAPTTPYEIYTIIEKMKLKNGGMDNINMKVIKNIAAYIIVPLVYIINLSIEKAIWPDALKCADIKPVFKSKNRHEMSNYRPISLISNLAKIFEKVLYIRISKFVKKYNLLSNKQFGFLKNLGTKDALNFISSLIYNKLDKSSPIAVTFLDLAKAFDTVNHNILLKKLYNYGIRGKAYDLISSYLDNRMQRVKINGIMSEFSVVKTGVPQGTILGPLFFILYINDLLTKIPNEVILSYADDTAVISTEKTWQLVQENMNSYLEIIANWLVVNKLSLNISKTTYITFGNYYDSVPQNIVIKINDVNIARSESCKYLGLYLDYRMRWENHIQYIISKTKYLVFLFYKLSKFLLTETLLLVYYAFFQSIINYGIIAWGGCYQTNLNMVQKLQTKIIKIISHNNMLNVKLPLNLNQLFTYESLIYHYNYLKNSFSNSSSITRNKSLPLPKISKAVGSKSSIYKATSIFNTIPNELKLINNVNTKSSKRKLRKWIKENV